MGFDIAEKEEIKLKIMMNKITAVLLAALMLISLIPVTVFAAEENKSTVTVYLSVSNDGWYLNGDDAENTTIARVPFTVEYFDLADYGLEQFYRYEADSFENGGAYISDTVVEQPTLLHLIIKATEKYMLNGEKYDPYTNSDVLSISGSSTSMFMQEFWGLDYNFNCYVVDDKYPLMASCWGATADYILLEDGMDIDIAFFTNYNFYIESGFASLSPENVQITTGDTVDFVTYLSATDRDTWSGETTKTECEYLTTLVLDEDWNVIDTITENYYNDGKFSYRFDKAGTYHIVALDPNLDPDNIYIGSEDSAIAPAVAEIIVADEEKYLYGDVNNDGEINITDATQIQKHIADMLSFDEITNELADVNSDGSVDITDVTLIQKYIADYDVSASAKIGEVYTKN